MNNFVVINIYNIKSFYIQFQEVVDQSDGCGGKFHALIVSPLFAGKALLQRHRYAYILHNKHYIKYLIVSIFSVWLTTP